jgi:hypothetical protein
MTYEQALVAAIESIDRLLDVTDDARSTRPQDGSDNAICGRCGHAAFWHANLGQGECQVKTGCDCYEFKSDSDARSTQEPQEPLVNELAEALSDLVGVAKQAMYDAGRDGCEFDSDIELAPARAAIAKYELLVRGEAREPQAGWQRDINLSEGGEFSLRGYDLWYIVHSDETGISWKRFGDIRELIAGLLLLVAPGVRPSQEKQK